MADKSNEGGFSDFWLVRLLRGIYVGIRGYFAFVGLLVTILIGSWAFLLLKGMEKMPASKADTLPKGPKVLTLNLEGPLAEHNPGTRERFFNMLRGEEETYIPELRAGLRRAAKDSDVQSLDINIGDVSGTAAEYVEIRRLMADFRESGKKITVTLEEPSEWRYYVATVADHIKINPTSSLSLIGPAFQLIYFSEALKKVGVGIEVMRAGKYKSAFESFIADEPSAETLEQYESMRTSLLDHIVETVASGRHKDPTLVHNWYRRSLFTAKEALAQGMVDELGYVGLLDESEEDNDNNSSQKSVSESTKDKSATTADNGPATSTTDEKGKAASNTPNSAAKDSPKSVPSQKRVSVSRYASATARSEEEGETDDGGLALIEAVGEITMHSRDEGFGDSEGITPNRLHRELTWAAEEDEVKAVVLRVSSPGGSAVASDMIWNDVRSLAAKKPVVVSMGAYAASGGYYISAPATHVIAEPTTVTGSIGVIGMLPNFAPFKEKYGVSFHAVSGTERVALVNPGKTPTEQDRELIGQAIDDTYKTFVSKVAEGRSLEIGKVEALAQGRVYTGIQAMKLGLVDELGGLQTAMNVAKKLGGLDPQKLYPVMQYESEGFDLRHCLRRPLDCLSISTRTQVPIGTLIGVITGAPTAMSSTAGVDSIIKKVSRWVEQAQTDGPLALWSGYVGVSLR
jgi:protease-4